MDFAYSGIQHLQKYVSKNTTTQLLVKGVVVILGVKILQNWLKMLSLRRKSKMNGPFPLPVFGSGISMAYEVWRYGLHGWMRRSCKEYGDVHIVIAGHPIVIVADPVLAKNISIKDSNIFYNRPDLNGALDLIEPWNNMLLFIKDEKWKRIRTIVSTAFTGAKLKNMSSCIVETANQLCDHMDSLNTKGEYFEASKYYANFATDVVFNCFFGIQIDSIKEPDHILVKTIQNSLKKSWLSIVLFVFAPGLAGWLLKNKYISFAADMKAMETMVALSNDMIEERRSKKIHRNDFIQMMVDLNEEEVAEDLGKDNAKLKKTLTNNELLSQSLLFSMVGTETTSTTLTNISYNLAMNQQVQDKLIAEIDTTLSSNNGEINFDVISQMEYMNLVISESQRMFGVLLSQREGHQDYEWNGMVIPEGIETSIAIDYMNNNDTYFPEPEKFIPERTRPNDIFLPFGSGPRTCVAMRFALFEIKLALTKILSRYRFEKCSKTVEKIIVDNNGLGASKEPIILKMVKRD